jgi:regulator of chromosome condensation
MATPNTLGARRMVSIRKNSKKEQFAKQLLGLNRSFYNWFKEQCAQDPSADLSAGFQDYVDHSTCLEDRFLRTYGEVLTFGSGDCGQLAHGSENPEDLEVKYPRIVYSLRDKKIVGIACGGIHNAAFSSTGQVYTWGCADDGALGRTGDENMPLLVESLAGETIIRVACGDSQTIAVSLQGDVWGWGSYKDKEGKHWFSPSESAPVPFKDIKKKQDTPLKVPGLRNIVEVACGCSFSIALDTQGVVYSWGLGESGELGRQAPPMKVGSGDDIKYDLPAVYEHHMTPGRMMIKDAVGKLMAAVNVKSIGCGGYHSLIATVGDEVYACGLNNYGQLGQEASNTAQWNLLEIKSLAGTGITMLRGGMHHSLALSSSGIIYSFGRGDSGQLGYQDSEVNSVGGCSHECRPLDPSTFKGFNPSNGESSRFVQIDCGGNHNLALSANGDVFTWGYGDMLALGHGDEQDEILPRKLNFNRAKIKNITITQIAGGGQHSAIIGKVLST